MNKILLILGGSSDIGTELIKVLNAKENENTIIAHYNHNKEKLSKIECLNGNKIVLYQADLTDEVQVMGLIKFLREKYGCPTSIIHLPADKYEFIRFTKMDTVKFEHACKLQVLSIIKILQAFLPQMVKGEDNAKIVFMLSENTVVDPAKFTAPYTMIKYMLLGMMKALVIDYKGKKININAVSPTIVGTKFLNNIDSRFLEANGTAEKMLCTADVIPAILFLLSKHSDCINGVNIHISN